jgi:predicted alpha/beta-fold hydrolase
VSLRSCSPERPLGADEQFYKFSAVDITPPNHKDLPPDAPTIIVAHGLTGGSHESYVRNVLEWVVRPKSQGGLGGRGVVANVSPPIACHTFLWPYPRHR